MSWGGPIAVPVFGPRYLLEPVSSSAAVRWYRFWHFRFLRRALRLLLSGTGDAVVYAQCPLSAKAALEARSGPSQRVVLAVHFQGSQAEEWVDAGKVARGGHTYRAIDAAEERVVPEVDGIVYVSEASKRALEAHVSSAQRVRSEVIPNFVARSQEIVVHSRPTRLEADLVTVGALLPIKNHGFLLEVVAEAERQGHRYSLDILGTGPMVRYLRERTEALRLTDQVRLLGHRDDVRAILPRYQLYVHASRRETLPLALIEALGAGLPILALPTPGMPELFDDGVEGALWPNDDPSCAASVLIALMEDPGRRARMSRAASDRFRQSFDSSVLGPKLEHFLFPLMSEVQVGQPCASEAEGGT